jgi:hypothetical protein
LTFGKFRTQGTKRKQAARQWTSGSVVTSRPRSVAPCTVGVATEEYERASKLKDPAGSYATETLPVLRKHLEAA